MVNTKFKVGNAIFGAGQFLIFAEINSENRKDYPEPQKRQSSMVEAQTIFLKGWKKFGCEKNTKRIMTFLPQFFIAASYPLCCSVFIESISQGKKRYFVVCVTCHSTIQSYHQPPFMLRMLKLFERFLTHKGFTERVLSKSWRRCVVHI